MSEYDKVCIETFLRDQLKLFPEKVAETPEEAEDFLDMCMAAVCKNMKEVREYFDETGADISGMSKEELEQAVFSGYRTHWLTQELLTAFELDASEDQSSLKLASDTMADYLYAHAKLPETGQTETKKEEGPDEFL